MKYDVIIIGAGAAGLTVANTLLRHHGKMNILLLEKEAVPGRKLCASGNGKCNISNADYDICHYHSFNAQRLTKIISPDFPDTVMQFMEDMGILLYEKNGYYYPVSNQARQVTSILFQRIKETGVTYFFHTRVHEIKKEKPDTGKKGKFTVSATLENGTTVDFYSRFVVLATGGKASGNLGGCEDGYHLAKKLNMEKTEIYPALAPIYVEDSYLAVAKGVRIDGEVALKNAEGRWIKERGQIQFNADCLSGICMMNLSGDVWHLTKEQRKDALCIDAFPSLSWNELKAYLIKRQEAVPDECLYDMLMGIFPEHFNQYLVKRLGLDKEKPMKVLTQRQLNRLTSHIKKLTFTPCMREDFERAQVTGGGVSLKEISLHGFESLRHPGLYLVGEILDVYGDCGGYNLTFAICSGIQAAKNIIEAAG